MSTASAILIVDDQPDGWIEIEPGLFAPTWSGPAGEDEDEDETLPTEDVWGSLDAEF